MITVCLVVTACKHNFWLLIIMQPKVSSNITTMVIMRLLVSNILSTAWLSSENTATIVSCWIFQHLNSYMYVEFLSSKKSKNALDSECLHEQLIICFFNGWKYYAG